MQYYDNLRKLNEHQSKNLNNAVDELEARGMIATSELYTSQMALNEEKKRNYQEELFQLEQQHDKIEKGTQDWYDSLDSIQACRDNIAQCTRNSIELGNAVRSIDWKIFDKASSRMDLISSEFDLGIKLMSNKNLTNKDTGNFTQEGTATLGAYYSKMLLAQNILIKTKRHIDNRDEGYTDQKALDEYNEKYKEYIQLAETEFDIQQNIVDMMKNRYQAELDCLQDVINKRKDLLQTEKDAFDYQRSIEEKTKNIAVITKQLTALSGDDSEEAKTRIQQLQVSLDEANKDLQDTE